MVEIFNESDGNLSFIKSKVISIIGYGNQGRAQALNLRDSGLTVIIGNIEDKYKEVAINDGFSVYRIKDAVSKSDISFILIPDELMGTIFKNELFYKNYNYSYYRRNYSQKSVFSYSLFI